MRLIRNACFLALALAMCAPPLARAQQEPPPLEDVTLRGRVLRPDGSPLANTAVRVDARSGFSFFGFFAFVFTGGLSALSCFSGPSELCPVSGGKQYFGATDANGRYSFTFEDAKRRGEQTDTDYILSVGMSSLASKGQVVVASYELELLDPVHDAPDLVMWDPAAEVEPRERSFALAFPPRRDSATRVSVQIGDRDSNIRVGSDGGVAARDIEDANVRLVPHANDDVTSKGTIYHQRFVAAGVALKGPLVPLSRHAACTVTRKDGTRVGSCGYTDGDLVTPAVRDAERACSYDDSGQPFPPGFDCVAPVTEAVIDLGAANEVGEVRSRCGCHVAGSLDATTWRDLPDNGELGAAQRLRYVRVRGESIGNTPEISVWGPWPDSASTPLAEPGATPLAPGGTSGEGGDDAGTPWLLAAIALTALIGVAHTTINRVQAARRAGRLLA